MVKVLENEAPPDQRAGSGAAALAGGPEALLVFEGASLALDSTAQTYVSRCCQRGIGSSAGSCWQQSRGQMGTHALSVRLVVPPWLSFVQCLAHFGRCWTSQAWRALFLSGAFAGLLRAQDRLTILAGRRCFCFQMRSLALAVASISPCHDPRVVVPLSAPPAAVVEGAAALGVVVD